MSIHMKNYSRKTNKSVTRYRTPAMFRLRAVINTQKNRLDDKRQRDFGNRPGK